MVKIHLILIPFSILNGCTVSDKDTVQLDFSFTEKEIAMIQFAANEWYDATDGEAVINIDTKFKYDRPLTIEQFEKKYENTVMFKGYNNDPAIEIIQENLNSYILGARAVNIIINIDNIVKEEHVSIVALHEFGHYLGILDLEYGLMAGGDPSNLEACIDLWAIDAYCSINYCGNNKHETCNQ